MTHYLKKKQSTILVPKVVQILELSNRDFKTTLINKYAEECSEKGRQHV